nr:hypothetical protein FEE99_11755 [Pseudomonas sp. ef1]
MISSFARQAKSALTNVSLFAGYASLKIRSECTGLFASRLAPTGECISNVGASLLAKRTEANE